MTVTHPRYGRGVVKQERHAGLECLVVFENGLVLWRRREELEFHDAVESQPVSQNTQTVPPNLLKERVIIEALRLGIVPDDEIEEFIFGRDDEIRKIKSLLDGPDSSLMIIGDYGTGKTHLLDYTYHMAIREGYAVARTDIDPNETPLHRPKYIYRKLISSFRFMDNGGRVSDFRQFIDQLIQYNPVVLESHKYLGAFIARMRSGNIDEGDWAWIEGEDSNTRPLLYNNAPAANIYCNILTGLGWATVKGLGLKGLVLLLDEAEILNSRLSNASQRDRGDNFLKGLLMSAHSDHALLTEFPFHIYGGSIAGSESGLFYSAYATDVRYLYRRRSYLKLIMTFTPIPELYDGQREVWRLLNNEPSMRIHALDFAALLEAFVHICRIYETAYGFNLSEASQIKVTEIISSRDQLKSSTRRFVKASIEALDILRFHSNQ